MKVMPAIPVMVKIFLKLIIKFNFAIFNIKQNGSLFVHAETFQITSFDDAF